MTDLNRRDVLTFAAAASAVALSAEALAGPDPKKGGAKDAANTPALSPQLKAVLDSTAECLATGPLCMARCTDHLAAGMTAMADCQKAVMNMLAVTEAMASVAGYRHADAKLMKMLASTCAAYCRTCEKACAAHAAMHEECKACGEACARCAAACDALPG